MRQKRHEIEAEIAHYSKLMAGINDRTALLTLVIADLESDKTRLCGEDK